MSTAGTREFDRRLASRHTYLGEFQDLSSSLPALEPGTRCTLPILALQGVVLMPGVTLPLCLFSHDITPVNMALEAVSPLVCIVVVVNDDRMAFSRHRFESQDSELIACTAQLRQIHAPANDVMRCLAFGRQRCKIHRLAGRDKVDVEILCEPCLHVPKEAKEDLFAISSLIYRIFDPLELSKRARLAYQRLIPFVPQPEIDPEAYSYWLANNLPLQITFKQKLLAVPSTTYRLSILIKILQNVREYVCKRCWRKLARAKDMLAMSESGSGSVCVNAYGYVSELMTLSQATNIALHGGPETEYTWFPGYAWTVAHCNRCLQQVGWKFTATEEGLQPGSFWGLRAQSIYMPYPSGLTDDEPLEEPEETEETPDFSD